MAEKLALWYPSRYCDQLCQAVEDAGPRSKTKAYQKAFVQLAWDYHRYAVTTGEFWLAFEAVQAAAWAAGVDADLLAMDEMLARDKLGA